jgi:hypothetical protein
MWVAPSPQGERTKYRPMPAPGENSGGGIALLSPARPAPASEKRHKPSLFYDACLGEGGDLVVRHVEDLFADLYRMLAEDRRRMAKLPRCL